MKLGIVILNYRTPELCVDCLESLVPQCREYGNECDVVVVDGASGDESVAKIGAAIANRNWADRVSLMALTENKGFSAGNNAAIRNMLNGAQPYDLIWLLNPDTVLREHALAALVASLNQNPTWGIVGSRLEDPDGTTQLAARNFPCIFNEFDSTARFGPISKVLRKWEVAPPEADVEHPCEWLPGASLLIRREVFNEIGLLDEGFFMYFEEVDFCRRAIKAGFGVGYAPQSRVIHLVGQASGVTSSLKPVRRRRPTYWFESRNRYFRRHFGIPGWIAANFAWVFGQMTHNVVSKLRGRSVDDPPQLLTDFIKNAFRLRAAPREPIY